MTSLTPEARALLEAGGDAEEPLDDVTRARMKRRLLSTVAAGGATATAASAAAATKVGAEVAGGAALAAAPATGLSLLTKIGLAVSFVAATSVGAVLTADPPPASSPPAPSAVAAPEAKVTAPVDPRGEGSTTENVDPEPEVPPDPESSTPEGAPVVATGDAVSAPRSPTGGEPSPAPSSLAEETAQLRRAQRELQEGDPERALELLEGHEGGVLQEEREAARVLALCRAGRVDEGRRAQQRFLAAHPRSPHRSRVLAACP